uniref:Uncharacterized protein n=1 Tax=Rhizophora mucronata TaxID=61149 RepID=A0A2P2PBV2_RHIMU
MKQALNIVRLNKTKWLETTPDIWNLVRK